MLSPCNPSSRAFAKCWWEEKEEEEEREREEEKGVGAKPRESTFSIRGGHGPCKHLEAYAP